MKLLDLSQINGGQQVLDAINVLNTSYPASKVTTTIANGGTTYTANELLTLLKTAVDDLSDPKSGTSVDAKIKTAADALQQSITAINDKQVSDYVKIYVKDFGAGAPTFCKLDQTIARTADVAKALTNTAVANAVNDVTATEISKFLKNEAYALYNLDNTPVVDVLGAQVTVTFANDGTPSLSNNPTSAKSVEKLVTVTNELATVDADGVTLQFKNRDIVDGSFTITKGGSPVLSSTYYERVLTGQVVFKTKQSGDYVGSYVYKKREVERTEVKSFTSTTVDNHDGTFTYAIAGYKLFPIGTFKFSELPDSFLLDNTEFNTVTYANALTDLYDQLFNESSLVDEIIDHLGDKGIQDALRTITDSLTERIVALEQDVAAILSPVVDVFSPLTRQFTFITSKTPLLSTLLLNVNGVHYNRDAYFVTTQAASTAATGPNDPFVTTVKWIASKLNGGFDVNDKHEVTLMYIADHDKAAAVVKKLKAGDVADVASTDVDFDTSGVTDFSGMFVGRQAATTPVFDSSAGTKFVNTFKDNVNLTTVTAATVDASAAVDVSGMFTGCTALVSVDGLAINPNAVVKDMFKGCTALKTVTLKSTGMFTAADLGLPNGCTLTISA